MPTKETVFTKPTQLLWLRNYVIQHSLFNIRVFIGQSTESTMAVSRNDICLRSFPSIGHIRLHCTLLTVWDVGTRGIAQTERHRTTHRTVRS